MTKKLLTGALITTPLIVINGTMAIYFQGGAGIQEVVVVGLLISVYVFLIWLINITLVTRVKVPQKWHLYVISFLIIGLVGFPFRLFVVSILTDLSTLDGFPNYPVLNALVVNSIVWVIIEMVRTGEEKKEAEATIDKLKIENLEAQKQSLIRQVQPHFLFNALSTLKSLISENQRDAESYTVKLSNFLRYSFANESADLTTLEQELDYVNNYIELQAIRFEGGFTHEIRIPENVMQYKIPVFALQTLVENIFKHNFFNEKKPLHFTIVHEEEGLTVRNEKIGLKLTDRNETGLLNLSKRYELTNGSSITILNTDEEFVVTIPLIP
ncbi:MAG: histidine kinase [Rhodothermaceae bacterium]|nr:histidine kinase [Rhodothermaceae bacterium]